jgi:hypothetical protein
LTLLSLALLGCPRDPDPTKDGPVGLCQDHPGEQTCDGTVAVTCTDAGQVDQTEDCSEGCAGGRCIECGTLEALYSSGEPVILEVDSPGELDQRFARWRAVEIEGGGTLSWTGPLEVVRQDGAELEPGEAVEDEVVLVGASELGEGELVLESCEEQTLLLQARAPVPLAVGALEGFPYISRHEVFAERDTVSAWLDTDTYSDRVGLTAELYVVPHREPADWAASGELSDAVAGPVPVTFGEGLQDQVVDLWAGLPSDVLLEGYDVVADFGADGALDPGDLLDGLDAPAFLVGGDLSAPGPYTPQQTEVSASFWLTMRVYWPEQLDSLDPLPLVVISHGNGHEYTWYDYLGEHLASHGYAVISHRNDTMPGPVTAAETTVENTDTFLGSLELIEDGVLEGEVDASSIAWIGHSRGGEGVVIAYNWLVEGEVVPENYAADDIRLVSSIAPTVFEDPRNVVNPHEVAYHLMAGSLDGDVTGGTSSPAVQYFRIFQNAQGLSAVTYLQGADHNDFNCCGFNDAAFAGPHGQEIGRARAQQAAKGYYLALLEATFPDRDGHDRDKMWEYFTRPPERFRPDGTEVIIASQLVRADGDHKVVIDDFQSNPELELSSSGGLVTGTVRELVEGVLEDGDGQLTWRADDPMNGMTQSSGDAGPERGIVLQWNEGDDDLVLEFEVPSDHRDWREDAFLSFRACQGTRHPNTNLLAQMLSFSVELEDGQGQTSAIDHRVYGGLTMPYSRGGEGSGMGWVNEFQTIRLPLEAFTYDGRPIDLGDIVAVRFLFGPSHGSAMGRVGLDDLEILAPGAP